MARRTVDQGLQRGLENNYAISAQEPVNAMCLSNFGALAANSTTVEAAANKVCVALDATPVRTGNKVVSKATFPQASIDGKAFTTITLHYGGAGVFTKLYGGVDGQTFTFNGVDVTVDIEDTWSSA